MAEDPDSKSGGWEQPPEGAPKHPWADEKYNQETPPELMRLGEDFAHKVYGLHEKLGEDLTPRIVAAAFEDFKEDQKSVELHYHDKVKLHDTWLAATYLANEPLHQGLRRDDISDKLATQMRNFDIVAACIKHAMEVVGETPPENVPIVE